MDNFIEEIYVHRDKESNWEIIDKAEEKWGTEIRDFAYLGSEIEFKVMLFKNGMNKVLEINGQDVSDKNISL